MAFFLESVRHPLRTGALTVTTRGCVQAFLSGADVRTARTVIELGAGTGAITGALSRRLPPDGHLLAVEVSPNLARQLGRRHAAPNVETVCASALRLPELVQERNLTTVDQVICTLPWTLMPLGEQRGILREVRQVLDADGVFSTLLSASRIRTRAGQRFESLLWDHFPDVRQGSTWWLNLPPLRAYHCRPSL
ncbi:MAG: methyltransferase domain-containing protein [Pseudonocardiaceae bacterium]|nr:methyltransferase domain-containing protein [Pseudonocardiaceae bacterium]